MATTDPKRRGDNELLLRVRFRDEEEPMTLLRLSDRAYRLDWLINVLAEANVAAVREASAGGKSVTRAPVDVTVIELNYASPLEVVLAITTGGASLVALSHSLVTLGNKILDLQGNYHQKKADKAEAQLREAFYRELREALSSSAPSTPNHALDKAVDALAEIESIGVALAEIESSEVLDKDRVRKQE